MYLDNCGLSVLTQTRNLGITVSNNLSPIAHVMDIVSKAHRQSALILHAFTSQGIKLLICAYVVYVWPLLEHNIVIWTPQFLKDIEAIMWVQLCFTKHVRWYGNYSSPERLCLLKMHSWELRRLVIDLVWCYKIVFHVVDTCIDDLFFTHCPSTCSHPDKLYKPHFSTNIWAHFFSQHVINVWNSLPADIINLGSVKMLAFSPQNRS